MTRKITFVALFVLVIAIGVGLRQKHNLDEQRAREIALRDDLAEMRKTIADYRSKHGRYPTSLNDLVTDGELRVIPIDPVTKSKTTWKPTIEESVHVDDFQTGSTKSAPSLVDVHSGATGSDSSGRPFADY